MSADRVEAAFAGVEAELDGERASALGRTGRKLEEALETVHRLRARARAGEHTPDLAEAHREALAAEEHWRWVLCLQREALRLYDHSWVDRVYPPPGEGLR